MKVKDKQHAQFVNDVLSLNKRQQLKKPSRTEPTTQISEFNLVKSVAGKEGGVRVNDLTKVLKKRAKHVAIGKKVTSTGRKAKTLSKPLEKPQADRIRRTVAFQNVKKQLNRWDAVVTANRASNRLTFPLPDATLERAKNFTGYRLKSKLQEKLEALTPKVEVFNLEQESEYPLTMKEMLERRKEMAKMRAVQSYKEAKARRQSKIKSKKYHRVQRREKTKQQLKEFEQLQKTDPAEALKKLEEIERVRVEERASLRHRSTGKWAKNKQVQAKYDKESRQVLAQQLTLSRDLTQKVKPTGDDSESDGEATNDVRVSNTKDNNPWTNPIKTSAEVSDFLSGYRKFWEDKNKDLAAQNSSAKPTANDNGVKHNEISNDVDDVVEEENVIKDKETQIEENVPICTNIEKDEEKINNKAKNQQAKQLKKLKSSNENTTLTNKTKQKCNANTSNLNKPESPKKQSVGSKKRPRVGTSEWDISSISTNDNEDIDDIFDICGEQLEKTLEHNYKKLKRDLAKEAQAKLLPQKGKKEKPQVPRTNKKIDLSLHTVARRPVIDEELLENHNGESASKSSLAVLETILNRNTEEDEKPTKQRRERNIDPNDIIKTNPVNLETGIPDLLTLDDNDENVDQRGTITEAFQDDDIVQEFKKDKKSEIDGDKPRDINLALPGWGSWGGAGIKPSKRKNKRFVIKFPKKFPRRDDNKGNLIINEKAKAKVKPHLVSDLPFPFKKVKDFEASIRAPIGNTFVPETAYRRMIKPAVKTKMGSIIEPMTDDILLKKNKK